MYDPDSLALSKHQIIKMIDDVMFEYRDNRSVKTVAWLLKQFCNRCDENALEKLWNTVALKVNDLFIANALRHAEENNPKFAETYKKIEEGKNNE